MSKVLDEKAIQGMKPGDRKKLARNLQNAKKGGQAAPPPRSSGGGGRVFFFLVYSVACAVGGAYLDRNWMPQARLWLGESVQTLQGFGAEQTILGVLEQAGYSDAEAQTAMVSVRAAYERKNQGHLDDDEVEELWRAERAFEKASHQGRVMSKDEAEDHLDVFRDLVR